MARRSPTTLRPLRPRSTLSKLRIPKQFKLPIVLTIRRGKGHKDRLIPLTPKTIDMLRAHWATHLLEAGVNLRQIQKYASSKEFMGKF